MKIASGSLPISSESSSSPSSAHATALALLRLAGLGAIAVALHVAARHRVEIGPGHQGLTWMALLMIGRLTSRQRWAGATTAAGAAGASRLPFWHLGDPFLWFAYALAGVVVDLGFEGYLYSRPALWLIALLGGAAHATKPLIRAALQFGAGLRYESLAGGLVFPLATHFLFGVGGALIGAAVIGISRRAARSHATQ